VAGVGLENRQFLLGHKSKHAATRYSASEIGSLIAASNQACLLELRKNVTH
jgi:hypothetical protein